MNKVALVIIYNHQYNRNIEILEHLYKDRFCAIYHLVPFYNGNESNVIPVYECSFYFQGYIAQGLKSYFSDEYDHYFFIADDLLLNPMINENNCSELLQLNSHSCFLSGFITLHEREEYWPRIGEAFHWRIGVSGIEVSNQLPDYQAALEAFRKFGLEIKPLRFEQIWETPSTINDWIKKIKRNKVFLVRFINSKIRNKKYHLSYPLVGSYSDIFVVSSNTIKQFCHYCGVFAATKLFVEVGLPTALVLSAKEIVTEMDLPFVSGALWTKEEYQILSRYENDLQLLLNDFPPNYLYLHPIKLSQWIIKT